MATTALYEGRNAGYYGDDKTGNPYRKGWVRDGFGGLRNQLSYAEEWDRGYADGHKLRCATLGDLMRMVGDAAGVKPSAVPK